VEAEKLEVHRIHGIFK